RADDDADRDAALSLDERRDRGGNLRRVGGQSREQAEQRLRKTEAQAHAVEPAGEDARRAERDNEAGEEERGGFWRRHGRTPTSLPGTPEASGYPVASASPTGICPFSGGAGLRTIVSAGACVR